MGGSQGGVSPGADDNVMLGIDGGGSGFEGGGSGSRLMANAGVRQFQNGPSILPAAAVDGQGPRGGQQVNDSAYRQGGGDGEGRGVSALPLRYGAIEYTVSVLVAPHNRDFICYRVFLTYHPVVSHLLCDHYPTCSSWFPYMNHSSLDRVRMNLEGIHTSRLSTRTSHVLVFI